MDFKLYIYVKKFRTSESPFP